MKKVYTLLSCPSLPPNSSEAPVGLYLRHRMNAADAQAQHRIAFIYMRLTWTRPWALSDRMGSKIVVSQLKQTNHLSTINAPPLPLKSPLRNHLNNLPEIQECGYA